MKPRPLRPSASVPGRSGRAWVIAGVSAAVLGLSLWLWQRPGGIVDDRGYDVVMSLYRVCNQRDVQALTRFGDVSESNQLSAASKAAIEAILADARRGDWDRATTRCRETMRRRVSFP